MAEAQDDEGRSQDGEVAAGSEPVPEQPDQDLVTQTLVFLARALVDHPDDVRVELFDAERAPGYRLMVHPDDMGKVIGRQGRIARSLRTVAKAAAARAGTHAYIEIGG